jgi:hypothetical protein
MDLHGPVPSTPHLALRALGLLSVPGALLLAFLTPVQAVAYGDGARPWLRELGSVHALADQVWSTLGGSLDRYDFWGLWTIVCYLGMIAGLRSFVQLVAPAVGGSRLLLTALYVAAVADVGAYWGGGWDLGSQIFGSLEFFALPFVVAGTVRFGYVLVRHGPRPRWVGWVMLASAAAVPVSLGLTNYWPHGLLLPISIGIAMLSLVAAAQPRSSEPLGTGLQPAGV